MALDFAVRTGRKPPEPASCRRDLGGLASRFVAVVGTSGPGRRLLPWSARGAVLGVCRWRVEESCLVRVSRLLSCLRHRPLQEPVEVSLSHNVLVEL